MFSKLEISKECFIFLQFTALKWDVSKVSENKYLEAFDLWLMSVLDTELYICKMEYYIANNYSF